MCPLCKVSFLILSVQTQRLKFEFYKCQGVAANLKVTFSWGEGHQVLMLFWVLHLERNQETYPYCFWALVMVHHRHFFTHESVNGATLTVLMLADDALHLIYRGWLNLQTHKMKRNTCSKCTTDDNAATDEHLLYLTWPGCISSKDKMKCYEELYFNTFFEGRKIA